ncbi:MAG: hypothetical protein IPH31_21570 [Lewinellaceae bacterium]|nr:hypothetical protein [Lewinellaceae bacterium]
MKFRGHEVKASPASKTMQYAVKFSCLAIEDLREICDWYEDKSAGLSDRFLDTPN